MNKVISLVLDDNLAGLQELISTKGKDIITEINQKVKHGYTPFAVSVTGGNLPIVSILINSGADINTQDNIGKTPLHYVSDHNYYEIGKLLIKHGANVFIEDNYGNQPLIDAVFYAAKEDDRIPYVKLYQFENKTADK